MELSFKKYLEALQAKPNIFSAMQDELGVDPSAAINTPNWAGNIAMGNVNYNGITYKIVKVVKNGTQVTGAMIQPIQVQGVKSQRAYTKTPEGMMKRPDSSVSTGERFVPINVLNQIMTQGMQAGGGGGSLGGL